jgi:FkbM family methyltransferase
MRDTLRKLLRRYKRPREVRPNRTFEQFFEHCKSLDFVPKTVIDVGAADGTPSILQAFPNAYHILIEPLTEFAPALQSLLRNHRGEFHNCAAMDTSDTTTILRSDDRYGSSLMHRIDDAEDKRLHTTETKTIDEIIAGRPLEQPLLIKTDCQGGDFSAVKGAKQTMKKTDMLIMEVSLFRFWGEHHPLPLEIMNYLDSEHGFVLYDILDGLFRPYDNALGQVDFVFVPEDHELRETSVW